MYPTFVELQTASFLSIQTLIFTFLLSQISAHTEHLTVGHSHQVLFTAAAKGGSLRVGSSLNVYDFLYNLRCIHFSAILHLVEDTHCNLFGTSRNSLRLAELLMRDERKVICYRKSKRR